MATVRKGLLAPISVEDLVSNRPPHPLYPPLGSEDELDAFKKAGRTVSFALSPRGNEFTAFESVKDPSASGTKRSRTLYFARWDKIRKEDANLFIDSFVTFQTLQRAHHLQDKEESLIQNPELIRTCHKALSAYNENLYTHIDRIDISHTSRFLHWSEVASTTHLLQVLYTSENGSPASSLIGEELLFWLNTNYVSPTQEEGTTLDSFEKPWLQEEFWEFIYKSILRGISKTALYFIKKISKSHPSKPLRRLLIELIPIIEKHPRSRDYDTEGDFLSAHRRWRDVLVAPFRRRVDELEEGEGRSAQVLSLSLGLGRGAGRGQGGQGGEEGEWRDAIEGLCALVEGDREAFFELVKAWGWGWRECVGVWGVWFDVRFTREVLPSTLPMILKNIPFDDAKPDELIQSALMSFDANAALEGARKWDLWLACHAADVLDKLGELEVNSSSSQSSSDKDLTLRNTLLIEYAEHIYTDPTLWQLTLEYLGACGPDQAPLIAELIKRVPIDIVLPGDFPPNPNDPSNENSKGKGRVVDLLDDTMDEDEIEARIGGLGGVGMEGPEEEEVEKAWREWEEKVLKIIGVCKDYELDEVMVSVCRSISQALIRRGLYGRAVQYSIMARDGRGVGQIADLLLNVYITKGADEFRAQVETIPSDLLPTSPSSTIASSNSAGKRRPGPMVANLDLFSSRLQFIAHYAEFHEMFARGEYKDAAKLLVVMLGAGVVPRWWWGVVLLDAGGMLDDTEMLFSQDDAYELLRHLEEIYTRAEQGAGAEYLGALDRIMRGSSASASGGDAPGGENTGAKGTKGRAKEGAVDVESTLGQLQVVRLALARYLARCSVGVSRLY